MANVTIGCRLPNGIILDLYADSGAILKSVELAGANSAVDSDIVILQPRHCGYTEVDAGFWEAWVAKNPEFAPFKSGAIFMAKDERSAKAMNKELQTEKTGFEAAPQTDSNGKIKSAEE